eukprot:5176294-Alexandrium_andersonii.AAC.1
MESKLETVDADALQSAALQSAASSYQAKYSQHVQQLHTAASEPTDYEKLLSKALEDYGFDMQGALGQRWARAKRSDGQLRSQYDAV